MIWHQRRTPAKFSHTDKNIMHCRVQSAITRRMWMNVAIAYKFFVVIRPKDFNTHTHTFHSFRHQNVRILWNFDVPSEWSTFESKTCNKHFPSRKSNFNSFEKFIETALNVVGLLIGPCVWIFVSWISFSPVNIIIFYEAPSI